MTMFTEETMTAHEALGDEHTGPVTYWLKDETGQGFQVSMDTHLSVAEENVVREEKNLPPLWIVRSTLERSNNDSSLRFGVNVSDLEKLVNELNSRNFITLNLPRLNGRNTFVGFPSAVILNTRNLGVTPVFDANSFGKNEDEEG